MTTFDAGQGPALPPRCARPDLMAALPSFAESSPERRRELAEHAARCRECGAQLAHLERAQAWIEQRLTPKVAPVCPSAEDLYDSGRGPGARRMSEPERMSIRAHVSTCPECSSLVDTLAHRPPVPVVIEEPATRLAADRRRRLRLLVPLAAAAAVAAALLWRGAGKTTPDNASDVHAHARIRFPADPPLRGQAPSDLWYPRDRVLRSSQALWSKLQFELAPHERASKYRVVLYRNDGSAFDSGRELVRLESTSPLFDSGSIAFELPAGHYTWEAWIEVDGLDLALGRRDFECVVDDGLVRELAERERAAEPARSEALLHLLHDAGFVGDARAFARTLPATPERDQYLARRPVR